MSQLTINITKKNSLEKALKSASRPKERLCIVLPQTNRKKVTKIQGKAKNGKFGGDRYAHIQ